MWSNGPILRSSGWQSHSCSFLFSRDTVISKDMLLSARGDNTALRAGTPWSYANEVTFQVSSDWTSGKAYRSGATNRAPGCMVPLSYWWAQHAAVPSWNIKAGSFSYWSMDQEFGYFKYPCRASGHQKKLSSCATCSWPSASRKSSTSSGLGDHHT